MQILSMTGYGMARETIDGFEYTVELKSVNNRHLDASVRMPRAFIFAEEPVKSVVAAHISRGKVDVFVTVKNAGVDDVLIQVNESLAAAYVRAVRALGEKFGLEEKLSALDAARFPDVLSVEKKEADREAITAALCRVTGAACAEFNAMRQREGQRLAEDILTKLTGIETLCGRVEARSPETVAEYRQRLTAKLREVLGTAGIDESRILTEAAIYADKVAVDEETVRLRSHIGQFRDLLGGSSPVGKKCDFLIQEMNREINTTGSKCSDLTITQTVIDMKAELEKIREQIQNIE